jgi:hypothetical protein
MVPACLVARARDVVGEPHLGHGDFCEAEKVVLRLLKRQLVLEEAQVVLEIHHHSRLKRVAPINAPRVSLSTS